MRITYNKFELELNSFLKSYLKDESFNLLQERLNLPNQESDSTSEKINEFYREQLQIDDHQSKDRIKIDRIITFSQNRLSSEKFSNFLNELAHICLSEGKLDIASEIFRKANKLSINARTKAESLLGLADVFSRRAKWNKSLDTLKKAKSLFKSSSDDCGLAKCENVLGTIYGELGDINQAKKHFLTSLSLINSDEELELSASLYTNLGIVNNIQGYFSDSLNHLNKALNIYSRLNKNNKASEVKINIAIANLDSGNYLEALTALDSAIEISKNGQFISILCVAYHVKSQVLIKMNDFFYASEFANKALQMSHNLDDRLTIADIYKVKGVIERHLGNYRIAETHLLNSLRINEGMNNQINVAETSYELGLLYEKMDNLQLKKSYLRRSKTYYENIESPINVERIDAILAFS